MAIQKYTLAANVSGTAINITNDKNDFILAISGNVNLSVIQRPLLQGGTGFVYTTSATTGAGSITSGGSGYPNGTYTGVRFSGGTGAGSKYTVVVSGGVVTTVTKTTNSTTNYGTSDILTFNGLPYGYDTIVIESSNSTPNQVSQSFSMPTNTIVSIADADTTAYTTTQLMNAIQSALSTVVGIVVNIGGLALGYLDNISTNSDTIVARTPALGAASMAASVPVVLATGTSTFASSSVSSSGTVAAATYASVSFETSASFTGSILGATKNASNIYTYAAGLGKTLAAIAYVVTTGSIIITTETQS